MNETGKHLDTFLEMYRDMLKSRYDTKSMSFEDINNEFLELQSYTGKDFEMLLPNEKKRVTSL